MTYLPPEEVAHARAVLAIIADPKAAEQLLNEIVAKTADMEAAADTARTIQAQNEKDRKDLAGPRAEFEKEKQALATRKLELDGRGTAIVQRERDAAAAVSDCAERERAVQEKHDALDDWHEKQKAAFDTTRTELDALTIELEAELKVARDLKADYEARLAKLKELLPT